MTIAVGDRIPEATLRHMTDAGPAPLSTTEVFAGKKVVLFAVPGAFTPTCSGKHLPGYLREAPALKAKGVDTLVCLSVNDPWVMHHWGLSQGVGDAILMLADGNGELTRKLGLEMDGTKSGLGIRARRFSMVVEDGVVKELNLENPGEFKVSDADTMLCQL